MFSLAHYFLLVLGSELLKCQLLVRTKITLLDYNVNVYF